MPTVLGVGVVRYTENLTSAVFVDDMLTYVFGQLGLERRPVVNNQVRNRVRPNLEVTFSPEIGNALLHILQAFPNISQTIMLYSTFLAPRGTTNLDQAVRVKRLLMCHQAQTLTDEDFDRDPRVWSSQILHFLVIITSLSMYCERPPRENVTGVDVYCNTCQLLHRKLAGRRREKVEKLKQYAASVLDEPPLSHTVIFEMD